MVCNYGILWSVTVLRYIMVCNYGILWSVTMVPEVYIMVCPPRLCVCEGEAGEPVDVSDP